MDAGPTSPNPGPTFPMAAAAAVMADTMSIPVMVRQIAPNIKITMKSTMKLEMFTIISLLIFLSPTLIVRTCLGFATRNNSLIAAFKDTTSLRTLIDPPVDPVHPPINIRISSIN